MATYTVQVKNINAGVKGMKLDAGNTATVEIDAEDSHEAMQSAVKQLFAGCRLHVEGKLGNDGTMIGQVTTGRSLYGKIWAHAEEGIDEMEF